MHSFLRKGLAPFIIAASVVIIDQVTKAIAVAKLTSVGSLPAIGTIVSFTLVKNTGAAFGLFRYQTVVLVVISVIAIAFTIFYLAKKKPALYLPFSLILGGAAGNLIDRLHPGGYVIDFIDLHFWPVFNVADSCITIGAVLLFVIILRGKDASRTV
ncbi:MAG: signal peptidase II [Candidatus Omnitrophica bacterium]|nr:signal peptidase II [Candidatus Omnitrophota bacterium]MDD5310429.1 signal peptidase II [Candidatus Omnitrophota bacterium]MDD5546727.1 signal peptidase II [Candidatus Omnitrophota bacterium]